MPGQLDGVGLTRWMRRHAPKVPVVLISGFPLRSNLWDINPSIAFVVKKPYLPVEVAEWIASFLGHEGNRRPETKGAEHP